jgi:hypothetical protein
MRRSSRVLAARSSKRQGPIYLSKNLTASCFFLLSSATMSLKHEENGDYSEKHAAGAPAYEPDGSSDPEVQAVAAGNLLHQDLKGRHMQMIAMQVQRPEMSSVYSTNVCVQWRSNWCWSVCELRRGFPDWWTRLCTSWFYDYWYVICDQELRHMN